MHPNTEWIMLWAERMAANVGMSAAYWCCQLAAECGQSDVPTNHAINMAYKESRAECDWCSATIYDMDDIACRKCYEVLEAKVAELEAQVEDLTSELKESRQ